MTKTFIITLGITHILGGFAETTRQGPLLISFLLGTAIAGILIGTFFSWIWTKTKNKSVKTMLIILFIILVGQDLVKIQSFIEKATFEGTCSKHLRSKNEASLFLRTIFSEFESSLQRVKKLDLKQTLDRIKEQLNKEDATLLTYFEELAKLVDFQEKTNLWINVFEKKDVETLKNLLNHILLTLKTGCKDDSEALENIRMMELISNFYMNCAYDKEKLEIIKEMTELGTEKFLKQLMDKNSAPEAKKRLSKALSHKAFIKSLENLIGSPLFGLLTEGIIKELAEILQFAELEFDLENYMKTKFHTLKDSPEGQRQIIKDIQKLKEKLSLLVEVAIKKACFS